MVTERHIRDLLHTAKAVISWFDCGCDPSQTSLQELMNAVRVFERDDAGQKTTPRFTIGTEFCTRGKHPRTCTVTDILTTTNAAGEIVSIRYVARHSFCGQEVFDRDVCSTTIARGLITA